jgi:ADP-dependent NAD(P)H-hydrate dehydratase / NAD(P)H-hydrate epimerase
LRYDAFDMQILTAEEMRIVDRVTVDRFGVNSLDLMENAGQAVGQFILREFAERDRISVLCGRGNNGGDGFVAARALLAAGRDVRVLLLGEIGDLKGDAKAMFERLQVQPVTAAHEADLASDAVKQLLSKADLLVDAVVGTGFQPPLRGVAAALAAIVNGHRAPVVAVDLPSGWDADSREYKTAGAFRADAVVTFTAPKLAHLFGNLTRGPIVVADIGSPPEAIQSGTRLTWAGSSKKLTEEPREPDSNKGKFGHILVIGGAVGKGGAPSMTSLAALRSGAGLVTAAIPGSMLPTVARVTPELMTVPLREGQHGEIDASNLEPDALEALLERKTLLAVGPGISSLPEAAAFVRGLVERTQLPMVLDADGLNAFAGKESLLDGSRRTLVLTPHPGEMATLIGKTVKEVQADREGVARDFATRHQVTLVLKGWRTLVAHPDGRIAVNTTGNPGMAKGGSGDILTGIVAALLGQYAEDTAEAVEAAVYLHGLAADFAVRAQDEHTLLATDTVAHLFQAFRFCPEEEGLYVWLQGIPRSLADR